MIYIDAKLFDSMVSYFQTLSVFTSGVAANDLRKLSEIKASLEDLSIRSKELHEAIAAYNRPQEEKLLKVMQRPLANMGKRIETIERGVTSGILNLTQFRRAVLEKIIPLKDTMLNTAAKFAPESVTDEDLKKRVRQVSLDDGPKDALRLLKKVAEEVEKSKGRIKNIEGTDDEKDRDAINEFSTFKNKLPSSLGGAKFRLVQMPIVPYSSFHLLNPKVLRRVGIEFKHIAKSYVVFEHQYLLAFDLREVPLASRRRSALQQKGLQARKRNAEHDEAMLEYISGIVNSISKAASDDYALMSAHFERHPSNGAIAFAWIAPMQVYKAFERLGKMNFEWGFPWSREAASVL